MMMYKVFYNRGSFVYDFTYEPLTYSEASRQLTRLKSLYWNADGTPRAYPNGKGRYDFSNPRMVAVGRSTS
jgi:hypothetical protein